MTSYLTSLMLHALAYHHRTRASATEKIHVSLSVTSSTISALYFHHFQAEYSIDNGYFGLLIVFNYICYSSSPIP
jgi:hypothetical protein